MENELESKWTENEKELLRRINEIEWVLRDYFMDELADAKSPRNFDQVKAFKLSRFLKRIS